MYFYTLLFLIFLFKIDYTFVSYLFQNKELPAHIFTLCLYEDGGYITLGGIDISFLCYCNFPLFFSLIFICF